MLRKIFPLTQMLLPCRPSTRLFDFCSIKQQQQDELSKWISQKSVIDTLNKKGIEKFLPIQSKTFQFVKNGIDMCASDRTGSGKTIAYSLPVIQRFREEGKFKDNSGIKFLILSPTRELALQIKKEIMSLRLSNSEFRVTAIYGGESYTIQTRQLKKGTDILVATPGRLIDFIGRENLLNFEDVSCICLDEADFMLEIGFKNDMEFIFSQVTAIAKQKPQFLFFSATMPNWVKEMTSLYMGESYKYVDMIEDKERKIPEGIKHFHVNSQPHEVTKTVQALIENNGNQGRVLIFTKTKAHANQISLALGFQSVVLHSDIQQFHRQIRLEKFRKGLSKIMIATDVAARGLDIPNVEIVIHASPPEKVDSYIHRAGRTGRAGREGTSITIVSFPEHYYLIKRVEKQANIKMQKMNDIGGKQTPQLEKSPFFFKFSNLHPGVTKEALFTALRSQNIEVQTISFSKGKRIQAICFVDQDNFQKVDNMQPIVVNNRKIFIRKMF